VPSVVLSTPHGVLNDAGTDRDAIACFDSPHVASVLECRPSGADPGDPPAVYRDLVLDCARAHDWPREGDAATRAS
jgi:isopenicillin N synthase-like dioxygenase